VFSFDSEKLEVKCWKMHEETYLTARCVCRRVRGYARNSENKRDGDPDIYLRYAEKTPPPPPIYHKGRTYHPAVKFVQAIISTTNRWRVIKATTN
jgi:hypothetical protein